MAIDPAIIGSRTAEHTVVVERGRLRFFAHATGQADPVYCDPDAAKQAGHRDLPVPPTFLFCLDMERPNPGAFYRDLGIDIRTILHGGQAFTYHAMAYAGDRLDFATRVTDVYAKKGGALEFIVRTTDVTRDGEPIAELVTTTVVRQIAADPTTKEASS
ncbi:MaoC family dehydratase N-terminal domain-containing protein [Yinghuangia soli]|uniref:MaoC family dehydratase N-terminal domain-containing protein n=1 Tax=Yinghuangia soli TaxID=2908204 RepID=A0AA41Q8M4_9ACTN|nr:MaoC family dehydratase N-terminal domain-containing protein [Yinghuangia soli]MCF2533629.1 MaoC family dehydratase N-terminal domain-containing protein [Yinghuangia soli]